MREEIAAGLGRAAHPALALLGVSLIARLLVAAARLPASGGLSAATRQAAAGLWQDLALSLAFALGAGALLAAAPVLGPWARRAARLLVRSTYTVLVLWLALNVAAAAVLGTPLTWPMLAGAGPALADSVIEVLSWARVLSIVAVLGGALILPLWLARRGQETDPAPALGQATPGIPRRALAIIGLAGLLGALLTPPPGGGHRNAVLALLTTAWRVGAAGGSAAGASEGGRIPLPDEGPALDLRSLQGQAKGRNLIWVVLESTGAAYLQPYGAALDAMPRLSLLARQGIVFEQAYTVYPESVKGLYSLFCARETAAYTEAADYAASRRPCTALATRLQSAGYRTALYHSGRFAYLGMRDIVAGRGFDRLLDAGDIGGPYLSSFGVDEASTVDRILSDLDQQPSDQPFFIHYLPIAGHHPYESPGRGPRPFGEDDNFHRYLSDLAMGDASLGRLIDGLDARGLGQNTLWVISGDHGEAFEQHPGNVLHSLFIYEENVHVPLIIVAPGLTDREPTRRAPQIASLIDVAPTVLALVGIAAPAGWRGRSLLDPIAGAARFHTDHGSWQTGLRHDRWKYILDRDRGSGRLFDLRADPGELTDVASRFPERAARYRADLEADRRP
ncbi:MAG: sulfatase [Ardenticatenia bacterium]|nr:sulfatase [Ardenticatenia bacterium]